MGGGLCPRCDPAELVEHGSAGGNPVSCPGDQARLQQAAYGPNCRPCVETHNGVSVAVQEKGNCCSYQSWLPSAAKERDSAEGKRPARQLGMFFLFRFFGCCRCLAAHHRETDKASTHTRGSCGGEDRCCGLGGRSGHPGLPTAVFPAFLQLDVDLHESGGG